MHVTEDRIKKYLDSHKDLRAIIRKALESDNENDLRDKASKIKSKLETQLYAIELIREELKEILPILSSAHEEVKGLSKQKGLLKAVIVRYKNAIALQKTTVLFTKSQERDIIHKQIRRQQRLADREKDIDGMEQEFNLKQQELQKAIEDTEIATSQYYRLSAEAKRILDEERQIILEGIEEHGSIAGALKNNKAITSTTRQIMYYKNKYPDFASDLDIAHQVFKENLNATMLDRAINGTENPVFSKGEYVGDYKVKDNKLLLDVAKAHVPEKYDRKAYQAENPAQKGGVTVNMINFSGVDETKHGYTKNVGVVLDVDQSGKVKRITQEEQSMIDFYEQKPGAEVVIPAETIEEDK